MAHESRARHAWLGWAALVAAVAWVVLRTPAGLVPYVDAYMEFARAWPASELSEIQEYIRSSAVGQAIYSVLPWHSLAVYVALHVTALLVALLVLATWLTRRSVEGLRVTRILVLGPLGAVLIAWIGSYDAFTVLLLALLFVALSGDRRAMSAGVGVLLGLQHFEQSVVVLVSLGMYAAFVRRFRAPWEPTVVGVAWAGGGVLAGKAVLGISLALQGFDGAGGRVLWVQGDRLEVYAQQVQGTWPVLLWSLFAGSWLAIIAWASMPRVGRWAVLACFLPPLAAALVAEDHTRLFALTAWPVLVLVLLRLAADSERAGEGAARPHGVPLRYVEYLSWVALPATVWGANVLMFGVASPL